MKDKDSLILENLYSENIKKSCDYCGKQLTYEEVMWNESYDLLSEATDCNGYIVYHGSNYVCIATGLIDKSKNEKTGPMAQVYIILSDIAPQEAIKTKKDATICFNCPHRGETCYVQAGQDPNNVFKSYKDGNYSFICKDPQNMKGFDDIDYYVKNGLWEVFSGKFVRFGAYGDPVKIPFPILEKIAESCSGFTGYTHQWKNPAFQAYKKYFMASVDSLDEYNEAKALGWRTFRVSTDWRIKDPNETFCLFSVNGTQCINCLKCNGNSTNDKDIYVKVHGAKWKVDKFITKFSEDPSLDIKLTPEEIKQIENIENRELEKRKNKNKNKTTKTKNGFDLSAILNKLGEKSKEM